MSRFVRWQNSSHGLQTPPGHCALLVQGMALFAPPSQCSPPPWPVVKMRAMTSVAVAGTDTDFRGEPFGTMGHLMAIAEQVTKLQAICVRCGDLACRNQRLIDGRPARYDSPTIMVGGQETYEARCRHCHEVPREDEDQTALL